MEIAYSNLIGDAPMLANPGEYRTMMYQAFWEGKAPKPVKPAPRGRGGRSSPPEPPRPSRAPPRHVIAELQAEAARIQELQAARRAAE